MSKLALIGLGTSFGPSRRWQDIDCRSTGRVRVAARSFRLRQDHDAAHDRRLHSPTRRPDRDERRGDLAPDYVVPPEKRGMSMIFQSYAIWPNMTVGENVAFGLKLRKLSAADLKRRLDRILDVVQLEAT